MEKRCGNIMMEFNSEKKMAMPAKGIDNAIRYERTINNGI